MPLSGGLALTHRCNLSCPHCYLATNMSSETIRKKELRTGQWLSLIDEITEAGCLFLLLTGGEPLLREDFADIYRHAKSRGLLLTIFTNGTLITDEVVELFDELPPRSVEISLYGATAATYEKVTGITGSHEKCLRGIHLLLAHGINLRLKSVLMTSNSHEFFEIERMAKHLGVRFRFDSAVFPRLDGDRSPLSLRIPPEEAVAKETADEDRLRKWATYYGKRKDLPATDRLYTCGAGLTHFHVDPYGNLQPCSMVTHFSYQLSGGDFVKGWREVIPRIREKKADAAYECNRCERKVLCGLCPAFFQIENGSETLRSEYLCEMGKLRFEAIQNAAAAAN